MSAPNLIPIEAVAERLNLSVRSVYALARSAQLPGVKVAHRWKFDPREVDRFIVRSTHRPAPTPRIEMPSARSLMRNPNSRAELDLPGADTFL